MNYNRVQRFEEITTAMLDLYKRKNADYGNSVAKTFDEYGLVSFLVRIEDKLNRVATLTKKSTTEQQVKDEKIEDTLLDLANYSIMALIELDRVKSEQVHSLNASSLSVHCCSSLRTLTLAFAIFITSISWTF